MSRGALPEPLVTDLLGVISTIADPVVIRKILTHLDLPTEIPPPRPSPRDLFGWS